jgi:preprotein translocase subunit SecG
MPPFFTIRESAGLSGLLPVQANILCKSAKGMEGFILKLSMVFAVYFF